MKPLRNLVTGRPALTRLRAFLMSVVCAADNRAFEARVSAAASHHPA